MRSGPPPLTETLPNGVRLVALPSPALATATESATESGSTRTAGELFADAAVKFLERHDSAGGTKPFFAYVAFTAPHDPRQPPPGFPANYASRPPLPKNFQPQLPDRKSVV